jgi:hypothetical protein
MIFLHVFCSSINLFNWLQNHLLPCPFKTITGIDCPGCGFQRSLIALIEGNLAKSWLLYPPTIPLLVLALFMGLSSKFPFKQHTAIQKILMIIVGNFVVISYVVKIFHH